MISAASGGRCLLLQTHDQDKKEGSDHVQINDAKMVFYLLL